MLRQASATKHVCALCSASPRIRMGTETAVRLSHSWVRKFSTARSPLVCEHRSHTRPTVRRSVSTMSQSPSGEQFAIAAGDAAAVIVEVGGGLRTFTAGGRDVLFGYDANRMCSAGRGQSLIPWPNRIGDGRYTFDGTEHELALNEVGKRTAIHGLVRWSSWTAAQHEPHRVAMSHTLHPQPGYPFTLELAIAYELSEGGLSVHATATNAGAAACPYGLGFHPYLAAAGGGTIDALDLLVPA